MINTPRSWTNLESEPALPYRIRYPRNSRSTEWLSNVAGAATGYGPSRTESSSGTGSTCGDEEPSPLAEVEVAPRAQILRSRRSSKQTRRCHRNLARTWVRQEPSKPARTEHHYREDPDAHRSHPSGFKTNLTGQNEIVGRTKTDPKIWRRCRVAGSTPAYST